MSIPIGPTLEDGLWIVIPEYYYRPVAIELVGASASTFSTQNLSQASLERGAAAIPKAGAMVGTYNPEITKALFGELV